MASQGKRMVNENLIAILKEMDSKGISIADLADVLDAFASGEVQEKLTAGDNISISEENVISATDTKYTAGDGITIEDGVISASAGEVWESVISFKALTGTICIRLFTKEQITASNVASILQAELLQKTLPVFPADDYPVSSGIAKMPYSIYGSSSTMANLQLYTINTTNGAVSREGAQVNYLINLTVMYSHKIN